MTLSVKRGVTYFNGAGDKITISHKVLDTKYPMVDTNGIRYTPDGKCYLDLPSILDIVREVTGPEDVFVLPEPENQVQHLQVKKPSVVTLTPSEDIDEIRIDISKCAKIPKLVIVHAINGFPPVHYQSPE